MGKAMQIEGERKGWGRQCRWGEERMGEAAGQALEAIQIRERERRRTLGMWGGWPYGERNLVMCNGREIQGQS